MCTVTAGWSGCEQPAIRVAPLLLVAAATTLAACSAPALLPSVSLRALLVLHQRRPAAPEARGRDVMLTLQLSFAPAPVPRHRLRFADVVLDPATWIDTPTCSDPLLCAWLSAAERAALVAWGVPP